MKDNTNKQHRALKSRHLQMISLGGAIGTGLFIMSSTTISESGPMLSLAYLIGGLAVFVLMRALGEMTVDTPVSGSFTHYAKEYIGDFAGYFTGWNFWFSYIIVGMLELTAASKLFCYWWPDIPTWTVALVFLLIMTAVNLCDVKAFGEFEFWLALIKVTTIILVIIFGIIVIVFNLGPNRDYVGIKNMWIHNGFSPNGITGFIYALVIATFSFGGVELVGASAGETENPEKTFPKAINQIIIRILLFYIGSVSIVMMVIPWDEIVRGTSPFVQMFNKLGIGTAATIINAVIVTAVLSAYNNGLFSTGRTLYSLAKQGTAPKMFSVLSKSGTPRRAILASSVLTSLTVAFNYILPDNALDILAYLTTIYVVSNWLIILLAQLRFRKMKTKEEIKKLSFKLPLYPYSNIFAFSFFSFVILLVAFIPDIPTIPGIPNILCITPIWVIILAITYKIKNIRNKNVKTNI